MSQIPKEHEKYNLLPETRDRDDWDCFLYPSLWELEDAGVDSLDPYGYASVEEYNHMIDRRIEEANSDHVVELLKKLQNDMVRMNDKNNWSVLRYIGPRFPEDTIKDLEEGQCYYWPCDIDNPVYQGVVDNEEYTSYWYPTEPDMWEILEDPTGMAYRTIYGKENYASRKQWTHIMDQVKTKLAKQEDENV